jgi:gamma-glutamylcyclotransferase (GGCT)/AIG2-like uncharacterized protein YtfP
MGIEVERGELDARLRRLNRTRQDSRDLDAELARTLGDPAHALVVYGTLAPGRENHHLLEMVTGEWAEVTIEGELGDWIGYPMFRWVSPGARVPAWLLRSSELTEHFERLDAFETSAYARHLVPYETATTFGVANCYVEAP